jgi:hypothetical protein
MRPLAFFSACAFSSAAIALALLSGCNDDAAPLPQGAWSLNFVDTGVTCDIKSHNGIVGKIGPSGQTTLVTDGVGGAEVTCSVVQTSSGFKVDAHVLSAGSNLHIALDNITKDATQTAPALGSVGYISPDTQNAFGSTAESPCNFYFLDPAEGVSPGNLWVAFDCPSVFYESQTCQIKAGYMKVVNCDGAVSG